MASEDKSFYGLQFHPEVTHTICGQRIIENFLHHICGCASDWNPGNTIEKHIKKVQEAVGNDQILLGLSGGVDSSVVEEFGSRGVFHKMLVDFFIGIDEARYRFKGKKQINVKRLEIVHYMMTPY